MLSVDNTEMGFIRLSNLKFSCSIPDVASFSDNFWNMGSDKVEEVIDAYVHALLGRFPRARYLVGKDASIVWRTVEKFPEWLSDLLIEKLFANGKMIPAYLSKQTR